MTTGTGDHVDVRIDDGIATVVLSNPRRLNALTWRMYDELEAGCRAISARDDVRVVVLTGDGGAFAAGTDITQFADFAGADDGVAYERRTAEVIAAVDELPMPVIAAVRGPAVGAGLALVLCCDITVAAADATFGAPVARTLGNTLAPDILRRLFQAVGRAAGLDLLLTAGVLDAEAARRAGLVARVVAPAEFGSAVHGLVATVSALAPLTTRALKATDRRLLRSAPVVDAEDLYRMCYGSKDFSAGVTAFLSKTTPEWSGR